MTVQEAVIEKLPTLSAEDQDKVLKFIESLEQSRERPIERKNPRGMFVHRGVHITAEEIDAARREAWANFPRDFPAGAAS